MADGAAPKWARWGLAWLPMVPIAIANGALRDLGYGPALGALRAHQGSTLTAIALFGVYIWFALRWLAPASLAVAARHTSKGADFMEKSAPFSFRRWG